MAQPLNKPSEAASSTASSSALSSSLSALQQGPSPLQGRDNAVQVHIKADVDVDGVVFVLTSTLANALDVCDDVMKKGYTQAVTSAISSADEYNQHQHRDHHEPERISMYTSAHQELYRLLDTLVLFALRLCAVVPAARDGLALWAVGEITKQGGGGDDDDDADDNEVGDDGGGGGDDGGGRGIRSCSSGVTSATRIPVIRTYTT